MSATPLRRPRLNLGIGPQVVAVLLLLGLAGAMAIQPTRQLLAQRSRIAEMSAELRRTEALNGRLEDYIGRLNDPDYIEQQARSQLGLVRPGETTFVVMPPSRRADKRAGQRRRPQPPPAAETTFLERLLGFLGVP
ncbi:MAG: septum formation initiator family protein [Actinomycetota bacterium]